MTLHVVLVLSPGCDQRASLVLRFLDLLLSHDCVISLLHHGIRFAKSALPNRLMSFRLDVPSDSCPVHPGPRSLEGRATLRSEYINKHRAEIIVVCEHFLAQGERACGLQPGLVICDEASVWSADLAACLGIPIILFNTGSLKSLKLLLEATPDSPNQSGTDDSDFTGVRLLSDKWASTTSIDCHGFGDVKDFFSGVLCFDYPDLYDPREMQYLKRLIREKISGLCPLWCLDLTRPMTHLSALVPAAELPTSGGINIGICLPEAIIYQERVIPKIQGALKVLKIDRASELTPPISVAKQLALKSGSLTITTCMWANLLACLDAGVRYFLMFPAEEEETSNAETLIKLDVATLISIDSSESHLLRLLNNVVQEKIKKTPAIRIDKSACGEEKLRKWLDLKASEFSVVPGSMP
eukprot:Blabericola_migrator_1__5535@NODE_281_length_10429_cov_52_996912_g231_i0_p3_GENE_NODE_281_length_10429_cov_52_996912_g231_i0NODE_281_length_10429_cov_52_996912_g231_i0_p3_ORF_typecomplete_len411_score52_35_NODE_281_length_10429_cov_52_996912_g231_i042595491